MSWKPSKKHLIEEDGSQVLCGHNAQPGFIVRRVKDTTCGLCLQVYRVRRMPKAHDDPEYWNKHRARRIAKGKCSKCKNKLFKWGLCRKHYRANRESTARRRDLVRRPIVNGKRLCICSSCGKAGHNKRSCGRG